MEKAKKKEAVTEAITHGTLITWVNEADDATEEARGISEKCRDYYDSKQLTAAEERQLKKRKQPVVVINRIKPKMDALMGMEKSAKTTVKALPRTTQHAHDADAATQSIRYVWQDNSFDQIRSQTWEFMVIEGYGGCEILPKKGKDGIKITIKPIYWDRIIYDPHSRNRYFTDARYLGQVVWLDFDEAMGSYPNAEDVLDTTISGSTTYEDKPDWVDTSRKRVKLVELYYREGGQWMHAIFTRGGFVEDPTPSPSVNEEGESEHPYEFVSSFVDREGQRYGSVKQLLDIQDEINKRRSKALHLMSVRQVRWERGAVDDINKARDELAKPDGVLETTPGMEFEVLKTGDMAAAQFNLLTEAKTEIDAVSVNAALTGKDQRAISGVALQERKLAGQTELGPMFDALKHWQYRVAKKTWNRIKQYWDDERWIRVTDDPLNVKFVGLNSMVSRGQMALEQAQQQGIEGPQLEQLKAVLAQDPSSQEMVKRNDISTLDVDLILEDVPDTATLDTENFTMMAEMIKSGFPLPPDAVIEASPLANKDKILKQMRAKPQIPEQVKQQMQQMQEEGKKLAEENQQLKGKQAETMAKLAADKEEAQAQLNLQAWKDEQELMLKKQKQDREAELAREKAIADAELARDKSASDAALRAEKETADFASRQRQADFDREMGDADRKRKDDDAEFNRTLKRQESEVDADTNLMPKIMEKIEKSFAPMVAALGKIVDLQAQTLQAIREPKRVMLGAITRDANGEITGATVNPSANGRMTIN